MRPHSALLPLVLILSLSSGCWPTNEEPRGLRLSEPTGGPTVTFDLDERPPPQAYVRPPMHEQTFVPDVAPELISDDEVDQD